MSKTRSKFYLATLVALSAGATVVSTAYAQTQSNVVVYGIVDAGVEYLDNIATAGRKESLARVNGSNQVASRFGIRAVEDLGGGLKALVNLENGFAPDTGATLQAGRLFGRAAIIGLEGSLGGITIGRQRNTIFDLALIYDPLGYGTYGITATDNAFFTQRPDNSLKYTFKQGPVSVSALYSFGRDALTGTPPGSQSEVPGNTKIGRQMGANLNYAAGPFSIGLGYDQQNGTTAASASETDRHIFLAGIYNLASTTKLYAGYMRRDNEIPAIDVKNDMYYVGVRHALSPKLGIAAALTHTKLEDSSDKATLLGTSLYYDFSKRTQWYLNLGYVNNGGASTQGVTGSTSAVAGENMTGVASGIVHRF